MKTIKDINTRIQILILLIIPLYPDFEFSFFNTFALYQPVRQSSILRINKEQNIRPEDFIYNTFYNVES